MSECSVLKTANAKKEEAVENLSEIKDQICDVCHKMWQLGWVAANDGNVSARLADGTILATPDRKSVV